MPIPWKELQAARKVIKLARKEKRKAERKAIRTERRRKAEESSKSRRRTSSSSSSESSTTSSSSALSSSPPRKKSRRSVTPLGILTAVGEPQRPQQSQARDTAVGEPERPQQPKKSPDVEVELEVVATKPAPRRERQVELSRAKEAATIPPLPPRPATPPQQQKKPAAKPEPLGGKKEAANKRDSSNERSFPAVHVQGRLKKGIKVKIPVENKRPARERLGSPVHRDREEVVEKLRELASAGSSSAEARGAEAISPPPRRAEANRQRKTTKEYPSVLEQEAYAVIPVHLDDFMVINEVVERMQTLRHPALREEIITLRNVLLRRLNDQALGPEAKRAVVSYCRERK